MTQPPTRLKLSFDVSVAEWVGDAMDDSARTMIGGMIPRGLESYARVLHPASDGDRSLRWAEIAERTGKPLTPTTWFQDIADSADEMGHGFDAPHLGEIPDEVLEAMMPILRDHTSSKHGWFCLWPGWAFVHGSLSRMILPPIGAPPSGRATRFKARPAFDLKAVGAARLPWCDYLLFEGPLEAVGELGGMVTWDPINGDGTDQPVTSFETHTPSLFWPDDRSWCAANDIEASFTIIGGTAQLIEALYDSDLEVAPVE